jgi:redox-sensitive bicupin YhaK (pirin superfamily)
MQHEDFTGHVGALRPGDVQFMTAGRGIVHSEMPAFDEDRPVDAVVLQLWIDLPAAKKMVKPHYQEKKASQLGHATFDGGSVAIVSGESHGSVGPVRPVAGTCWFMDFRLLPGGQVWQPLPEGWTAFVYVLTGTLAVGDGDKVIEPHYTAVFSSDKGENGVLLRKPSGKQETRFVLVAGEPLNQPVIQQGPFVTTSKEAAVQALRDYDGYRNGFEKARGWSSTIGNPGRRPAKKR